MFRDEDAGVHSFQCKCCFGTGNIKTEIVDCDGVQKTVQIMEFTECGCKECKEGMAFLISYRMFVLLSVNKS